jgi:hypothetical protein
MQTHPKQSMAIRCAGNGRSLNLVVVGRPVEDVMEGGAWEELDSMSPHLLDSSARGQAMVAALA